MTTLGIQHLGLTVPDVEVTAAFFVEALGYKIVTRVEDYPAIFITDDSVMLTLWAADTDAKAFDRRKNVGLHHLALRVGDKETLYSKHKQMLARSDVTVEFAPASVGPGEHFIMVVPGGIRVELVWWP